MTVTSALAPDTLVLWHPSADRALTPDDIDFGQVAAGGSADRRFRVRNASTRYWAVDVVVTAVPNDAADDGDDQVSEQVLLSADGRLFETQIDAGSLGPAALTPVFTMRALIPADAATGAGAFLLAATARTWS